jgi:hypothetical protein
MQYSDKSRNRLPCFPANLSPLPRILGIRS